MLRVPVYSSTVEDAMVATSSLLKSTSIKQTTNICKCVEMYIGSHAFMRYHYIVMLLTPPVLHSGM